MKSGSGERQDTAWVKVQHQLSSSDVQTGSDSSGYESQYSRTDGSHGGATLQESTEGRRENLDSARGSHQHRPRSLENPAVVYSNK